MLTHEAMLRLQAEQHDLINARRFRTKEQYILHLIHAFAYMQASLLVESKIVLDLGCNTGYGSEILSRTANRVVGVDVSDKAISAARAEYGHLGIDFQHVDGNQLPFSDRLFDVIVSCQVIEHIVDHNAYVAELRRVLSPHGFVFFTTPNALLRLDPGMKPWNRFHVQEFDHSSLQALLNQYFPAVRVFGLFAIESLYSIESSRLNAARERARMKQQLGRYRYLFKTLLASIHPGRLLGKVRQFQLTGLLSKSTANREFTSEHGLEDLFYRTEQLEKALDLAAVCGYDPDVLHCQADRLTIA